MFKGKVTKVMFLGANVVRNPKTSEDTVIVQLAAHADPCSVYNIELSIDDTAKCLEEMRDCIVTHETQ